jgi:hypothetical protein
MVFSSLASKLVVTVSPGLASKLAVGFLIEPQNQGGGGFPSLGLKTGRLWFVGCATKSMKGGRRGTHKTGGERGTIVEVASAAS